MYRINNETCENNWYNRMFQGLQYSDMFAWFFFCVFLRCNVKKSIDIDKNLSSFNNVYIPPQMLHNRFHQRFFLHLFDICDMCFDCKLLIPVHRMGKSGLFFDVLLATAEPLLGLAKPNLWRRTMHKELCYQKIRLIWQLVFLLVITFE